MYEINSSTITFTTRFVMTLTEMKKGDSFTVKSSYSTDTLTLDEINNLISIWSFTEQDSIISRFKYDEEETEGFGKVRVSVDKHENIEFDSKGVETGKTVDYIINIIAVEDIPANSVLRLGDEFVEEIPEDLPEEVVEGETPETLPDETVVGVE